MAVYAEPGYLLFQREGTLWAQPFDAKKLTLSGQSVSIAENLLIHAYSGSAVFDISQDGLLIYRCAAVQSGSQFVWFDRTGKQLGPAGEPAMTYLPQFDLSPDGKRIAVSRFDAAMKNADIWLLEYERNVATRLTFDPTYHGSVVWSPDGLRVGISSMRKGRWDISIKDVNGTREETLLSEAAGDKWMKDWSKDGRYIAYGSSTGGIYALPLFGDRKPFPIVQSSSNMNQPIFSYDGKWLAFDSDESNTWQIYVVSFPATDQKRQISTISGAQPRWRRDGKELYYLTLDGKMMAVDIKADAKIEPGIPHTLFNTGLVVDPTNPQYAVTPDGQRFLLLKSLTEATPIPITVAINWTALLKK